MGKFERYEPSPEEIKKAEGMMSPERRTMSRGREKEYSSHEKDLALDDLLREEGIGELKELYAVFVRAEQGGKLEIPEWVKTQGWDIPGTIAHELFESIRTQQLRSSIIEKFLQEKIGLEEAERYKQEVIRRYKKATESFRESFGKSRK